MRPPSTVRGLVPVVVAIEVLLRWVRAVNSGRPFHNSNIVASLRIVVQEASAVRRLQEDISPLIQLLAQAVHTPRRIGVGYSIAQDLGKAGVGGLRRRFVVGDLTFDAVRVRYALRPCPGRLQLAQAAGRIPGASRGRIMAGFLRRRPSRA